ncbi:prolyl 3-hydroxylase OGFOD1 [Pseudomyrmex gracilis]|uniref:prolyl 3-hydroxylase OGFOD1 n=1 Tax=Pseudomyrmex gracilis TaxID=219809 RepID=UPI0009956EA1|nr:prolyl 3-hydroxylase OGFOD1 [Pseudomyrmex gracilis]XP_020290417.1 prolyl 3-hydroxylase OGFOD1 [Pseudomyrmex gracilis]
MADRKSLTLTQQRYGLFSDNLFNSTEVQEVFQKHWHERVKIYHDVDRSSDVYFNIYPKPFRHCKISHFIKSKKFLSDLMTEVDKLDHVQLTSDLYKFSKSMDLSEVPGDNIQLLYRALQIDLGLWLERNTGIKLNTKVTMTSSRYYDTDYLLCHDDNMCHTRKIAFILYLHKGWGLHDGGSLDIFDTDEHGQPREIVHTIVPAHNSLVFFEVSDKSYHQVAEVEAANKCRWSINGWFHGSLRNDQKEIMIKLWPEKVFFEPSAEENLKSWISRNYLSSNVIKDIHKNVEQQSYILIPTFVKPSVFEMLTNAIQAEDITWRLVGPPNLRTYEIADEETLPLCLKLFLNMFKSKSFFRLLTKYTGLSLMPDQQAVRPTMTIELQRWSKGCYTLLCDTRKLASSDSDSRLARPSDDDTSLRSTTNTTSSTDVASLSRSDAKISPTNRNKKSISSPSSDGTFGKVAKYSDSPSDETSLTNTTNVTSLTNTTNVTSSTDVASSSKSDAKSSQTNRNKRTIRTSPSDGICEKVAKYSDSQKNVITSSSSTNKDAELTKESSPEVLSSDDSRSTSIDDYLSSDMELSNGSSDDYTSDSDDSNAEYVLDVILQFHNKCSRKLSTFDYVDPNNENGVFIQVPQKDNHLLIVYRQTRVYRFHPYINHLFDGYFYNLVCTYRE